MKAMILSAGQGSRRENLVNDSPRCLVESNVRRRLHWKLDTLEGNGTKEAVVASRIRYQLVSAATARNTTRVAAA
jgi:choline kinase